MPSRRSLGPNASFKCPRWRLRAPRRPLIWPQRRQTAGVMLTSESPVTKAPRAHAGLRRTLRRPLEGLNAGRGHAGLVAPRRFQIHRPFTTTFEGLTKVSESLRKLVGFHTDCQVPCRLVETLYPLLVPLRRPLRVSTPELLDPTPAFRTITSILVPTTHQICVQAASKNPHACSTDMKPNFWAHTRALGTPCTLQGPTCLQEPHTYFWGPNACP